MVCPGAGRRGGAAEGRPGQGVERGRSAAAPAAVRPQRAGRQEEGNRAAGFPAPVQGLHADHPAGRGRAQPGGHARRAHVAHAGGADGLQRRAGHARRVQGRSQPGRAREDDEEHRPCAPRRPGHRDRGRAAGAGRHRADGGGQPRAGRRPPLRHRHPRDRGGRPHRRERGHAQGHRHHRQARGAARRPHQHGLHEHGRDARARRDDRHHHRHGHRDGPHRRPAQQDRGRQDPAAEAARPPDHHHRQPGRPRLCPDGHHGAAQRRLLPDHLHRRHCPGDFGHPHRPARGRDHHVLHGHTPAGRPGRHRQAAALGRDAGLGLGHLLGQDRHAHAQQDDGARVHRPRPEPLQGDRRRLQHQGRAAACRRRQDRPRRRPAADGAVRRRPPRRRGTDRRPHRGCADRAGGKGRHQRRRCPPDVPARGRGALRLRLQVHGHLPQHDGRAGQGRRARLCQGCARRAHRAQQLLLAAGRRGEAGHAGQGCVGAPGKRAHGARPANA